MLIKSLFNCQNINLLWKTVQHQNPRSTLLKAPKFVHYRFLSSTTSTNFGRKTQPVPDEKGTIPIQNKTVLNSNFTLLKYEHQNGTDSDTSNSKLVVLFGWMLSKDKNMEKYAQIYARHNFDVLLVKTYPKQLIFPKNGSIKNAQYVIDFIEKNQQYSQVAFHGFSIGGYQFGEVLAKLTQNPKEAKYIIPLVKALVFDSAADLNNLPNGFSRAITQNVVLQKFFFLFMVTYLKLFYFVATKYYIVSQDEFYAMKHFAVPSLMLVSERDKVGSIESNQLVMNSWIKRGVPVKMKIFKDSKHVSHYQKYPDEYRQEIDELLKKAKLA